MSAIDNYNHYVQHMFNECERIMTREIGGVHTIDRNTVQELAGEGSLEFKIRHRGQYFNMVHFIDPQWSLEKNAWKIAQKHGQQLKKYKGP